MKNFDVIRCPKCNKEYLPSEIFIPNAFFGAPDIIKRDTEGHIIDYIGKGLDPTEKYTCDLCNTTFDILAKLSFETNIDEGSNFAEEYVSVPKVKFKLDEF